MNFSPMADLGSEGAVHCIPVVIREVLLHEREDTGDASSVESANTCGFRHLG